MVRAADDNQKDIVKEAIRQFVDASMHGEKPDLDEFVKHYPGLENQIRRGIQELHKINNLFDSLVQAEENDFEATAISDNLVGQKLRDFEIVKVIGRGGMGVVYLARDTKLGRSVAIKSMSADLAIAKTRFRREATLLASLNHPNIAVIHEIIEEKELGYLILEYVPGQTLAQRIARKPLGLREALLIGWQIAEAVSAAHDKGIIHRDLKPGNIKITLDGRVKVLDFGLAKPSYEVVSHDSTITRPGSLIGTPAYMSPEQIRGSSTDSRTDIWSFGCIMYEMLTGKRPFVGDTVSDTVAYVLVREPDWEVLPHETPKNIRNLVRRCIEKDQQLRLQHIGEAAIEINQFLNQPSIAVTFDAEPSEISRVRKEQRWRHIAVLPFVNMSADPVNEYFSDGLAEDLINALAQIEGLRVVARTSAFQFKDQALDIREIGKRLNVETVLEGSVRKAGEKLRITAQLIDVADGYHIWSERYARELQDVFAIQDDITKKIVSALKVKLIGDQELLHVRHYTDNVNAYNLYLQGRFHWNKRTPDAFSRAISYFEQALAVDPNYAMAHVGLADCYTMMSVYGLSFGNEVMPRGRVAAQKALEIDDSLPAAHCSLGLVSAIYEYDWLTAERHFQLAIELDPDHAIAHAWYAWFLLVPNARFEEAEVEAKRVLELDPLTPAIDVTLGFVYHMQQREDEAIEACQRLLELDPDHTSANFWLGEAYLAHGLYSEAIATFERAGVFLGAVAGRALAYGLSNQRKKSQKLLEDLAHSIREGAPGTAAWMARSYAKLGEIELAFEYLEKAYRDRDTQVVWLKIDPFYVTLRSDRRFEFLINRMNLLH
jgi:serine/threonine protein kinase/tetratricopeptide (TPR) repeat protein